MSFRFGCELRTQWHWTICNEVKVWSRPPLDLFAVRIAQAYPGVAHLLVMHHRVVDLDVETEPLHRQCTDRREHRLEIRIGTTDRANGCRTRMPQSSR